jgi:polysaccharide biosynthesis/export protein
LKLGHRLRPVLLLGLLMAFVIPLTLTGCATDGGGRAELPTASGEAKYTTRYRIAPGDTLDIFVWQHPDLSSTVPVRPDGLISAPLLEEVPAAGKTPADLARELEEILAAYLRNPSVTVIVNEFSGTFGEQIRVLGEAAEPKALIYKDSMTLLDAMIGTGGITEFADGNNATLVRVVEGQQQSYRLRLNDLIRDGDISANVDLQPGDVIIVPATWF